MLPLISCNSPLTYTRQQVEVLLTAAENGVPIAINTAPLAGATAPYTLAGFVAQATFVSLFAVLVLSMFDHIFFDRNVGHAFFALLAIVASYDRMVRERLLPGMEAAEQESASALWTD